MQKISAGEDEIFELGVASIGNIGPNEVKSFNCTFNIPHTAPETLFYKLIPSGKVGSLVTIEYYLDFWSDVSMSGVTKYNLPIYVSRRSFPMEQWKGFGTQVQQVQQMGKENVHVEQQNVQPISQSMS
jgi:hypothetical protein